MMMSQTHEIENQIKTPMKGLYINVGSEKCCCFVEMSTYLIRRLEKYPLLYYAVEEALECAKIGYYGIGIVAFAQLLNLVDEETPESRHLVAHELLDQRPTKESLENVVNEFKNAARKRSVKERSMHANTTEYQQRVHTEWKCFISKLHPEIVTNSKNSFV